MLLLAEGVKGVCNLLALSRVGQNSYRGIRDHLEYFFVVDTCFEYSGTRN